MRFGVTAVLILFLTGVHVWGEAQEWTILRHDDFVRNDGVQGILQDVHFTNTQNGWAVGLGNLVLHTVDGGNTWTKLEFDLERPIDFWNLYFYDENVGFITGVGGTILKTTDGGATWVRKKWEVEEGVSGRSRLTDTWLVDGKMGFMVGENNTLLTTTDSGETWSGEGRRVAVGQTP